MPRHSYGHRGHRYALRLALGPLIIAAILAGLAWLHEGTK